ncbi:MAG: sigma-70 family RNA polymerase sigma factor [Kineosporiaceae bacterium]
MSVAFSDDAAARRQASGRDPVVRRDGVPHLVVLPPAASAAAPALGERVATTAPSPSRAEDAALVARCREGDPDAYAALFRRWFGSCRTAAAGVLGHDDPSLEPDDIAQEALVAAWARLEQLREPAAFGAWACQIARNLARDHLKRRRPAVQPLDALGEEHAALVQAGEDPQRILDGRERDGLVRQAGRSLRGREGDAFAQVVDHGMNPGQVARALGVSDNNAYQILFRLRGRLQTAVRGALVWRQGRPRCDGLARVLHGREQEFTPETAAAVARHVRQCMACTREADVQTHPTRLLSGWCLAWWAKWGHVPWRWRAEDAVGAGQGVDAAVRVGAGIGVVTTMTAGMLAVSGVLPTPTPVEAHPNGRPNAVVAAEPGTRPGARRPGAAGAGPAAAALLVDPRCAQGLTAAASATPIASPLAARAPGRRRPPQHVPSPRTPRRFQVRRAWRPPAALASGRPPVQIAVAPGSPAGGAPAAVPTTPRSGAAAPGDGVGGVPADAACSALHARPARRRLAAACGPRPAPARPAPPVPSGAPAVPAPGALPPSAAPTVGAASPGPRPSVIPTGPSPVPTATRPSPPRPTPTHAPVAAAAVPPSGQPGGGKVTMKPDPASP